MKIIQKNPPNFDEIVKTFDISKSEPLFTYAPDIYNPHKSPISPDLMLHEMVHIKQQGDNPKEWWDKYLTDKKFRLEQEVEAYGIQFASLKSVVRDDISKQFLTRFAVVLSSPMYGSMLSLQEAESKIRNYAKNCLTS
jgi:hypothetical protein